MSIQKSMFAILLILSPVQALAQQWNGVVYQQTPSPNPLAGTPVNPNGVIAATCNCIYGSGYVSLSSFASQGDVTSQFSGVASQLSSLNNQINNVAAQSANQFSKALDGAALGVASKDAIPNPGDKFAVRFNTGEVDGHVAGSVGASMNITSSTRASFNYSQSQSVSAVSGGVNFSFN